MFQHIVYNLANRQGLFVYCVLEHVKPDFGWVLHVQQLANFVKSCSKR